MRKPIFENEKEFIKFNEIVSAECKKQGCRNADGDCDACELKIAKQLGFIKQNTGK